MQVQAFKVVLVLFNSVSTSFILQRQEKLTYVISQLFCLHSHNLNFDSWSMHDIIENMIIFSLFNVCEA